MDEINKGIVCKTLVNLNKYYKPNFTKKNLACMFNTDKKTIKKWMSGNYVCSEFESNYENLDNLVMLYLYLNQVMQSKKNIDTFLNTPNPNLETRKPLTVMKKEQDGITKVLNLLKLALK